MFVCCASEPRYCCNDDDSGERSEITPIDDSLFGTRGPEPAYILQQSVLGDKLSYNDGASGDPAACAVEPQTAVQTASSEGESNIIETVSAGSMTLMAAIGGGDQKLGEAISNTAESKNKMMETKEAATSQALAKPSVKSREFSVKFARPFVGLSVDVEGNTVIIEEVHHGGESFAWNKQNPDKQLKHGDRIVAVNGVHGAAQVVEMLRADPPLEVVIRRPIEFTATLCKPTDGTVRPMGLGIAPSGKQGFIIKKVQPGLVYDWNKANPGREVKPGDRIVETNNVRDDREKLMQLIQSAPILVAVFSRNNDDD